MTVIDRRFAPSAISWALLAQLGALAIGTNVAIAEPMKFEVAASDASNALSTFSTQAGLQILFEHRAVEGRRTQAVVGEYEPSAALELLLKQSGLTFEFVNENTVAIREPARERAQNVATSPAFFQKTSAVSTSSSAVRVAQAADSDDQVSDVRGNDAKTAAADGAVRLEEVIVTGSHIRGAQNLSAPVIRFDRSDIERSGYATTQDFMRALPQNLGNVSDTTFGGENGGAGQLATFDGAGINLRGLGADATLTLLNGRRLAGAGNGSFVDISLIPLSAIERIEVLTDGASALYGSDAVGGAVNLILRKDFMGAETRARYGAVTAGDHDEMQLGQTFGHAWGSGQALVTYEYLRRSDLLATDRDFYEPVGFYHAPSLVPSQKRHSALAMLTQQLSDKVELSLDISYGDRGGTSSYQNAGGIPSDTDTKVKQYGGAVGLNVDLARDWEARLTAALDQSDAYGASFQDGAFSFSYGRESRLATIDAVVDGPLMSAPGGMVRIALGGQYRSQEFVEEIASYPGEFDRDVKAAYTEVLVPWVGASNRRVGIERLEMSLAGRYEKYSDVGSSFNPKIGLAWMPVRGLNMRGTWGTSFKAPLLSQMNPGNVFVNIANQALITTSGGLESGILLSGNNPDLEPEESENWTVGFDFTPESAPGLSVTATYFSVEYTDRVRSAFPPLYSHFEYLLDPTYAVAITRDPDITRVAELMAHPTAYCFGPGYSGCESGLPAPEEISVIVDNRLRNLASVHTTGFDFSATYGIGDWNFQISGQHLLKSREKLVPGAPDVDAINDVWRPVDTSLRGGISWSHGPLSVSTFANYKDDYRDTRSPITLGTSVQRPDVASWTTFDMTLRYELMHSLPLVNDTVLTLSAFNLFDRDPPYVANQAGFFFDGVNADPRGRFISAQVVARW